MSAARPCLRILLPLVWMTVAAAFAQAGGSSPTRPSFQPFRYDEDWSALASGSTDRDLFDPIKYLPLGRPGWFVTLGVEVRERFELLDHPNFGAGPSDENGYSLQRFLFSADTHLGRSVRFFTEFQSGLENGRNGGPRPTDQDTLSVHQAFFDWNLYHSESASFTIRTGRQELGFGSGRLLSPAEGLNVRRSMDGVRLSGKLRRLSWNTTALRLVKSGQGVFDDVPDHAQSFWGAGLTAPHPFWKRANMSLYYMGLDRKSSVFQAGVGRSVRHTIGSRSWRHSDTWDANYEAIVQWGSFEGRSIRAWALSEETGHVVKILRFSPRIGLRADIASGDRGRSRTTLGSFDPLFPAAPVYSGPSGVLGPTNLIDLTPSTRFPLGRTLSLTLESSWFWRQSLADGIYTPFVTPLRRGDSSQARFVAAAPSATFAWQQTRHISYTAIYTHFFAGRFLEQSRPVRQVNYAAVSVLLRI